MTYKNNSHRKFVHMFRIFAIFSLSLTFLLGLERVSYSDGVKMIEAAQAGDLDHVNELLLIGADPNYVLDGTPVTPLFLAAQNGHSSVVEALLTAGADINDSQSFGASALLIASQMGHADTVDVLLRSGADADFRHSSGMTPLMIAAQSGHTDVVRQLATGNADLDLQIGEEAGRGTALMLAIANQQTETASLLLRLGANAEIKAVSNITALVIAARVGDVETLELLIKSGATINHRSDTGATSLFDAAQNGHVQVVSSLLESGADPKIPNNSNILPLNIAKKYEIIELLNLYTD